MKSDVLVIGGGVIGLAAALELLEAGRSVRILERERVGSGASHGNCGLITPSHALPLTQPGMIRRVLKWMLRSDSPIYLRPRFDPALFAWGLAFSRNCNEAAMRRTMHARSALLSRSRALYDDWIERYELDCEWEARGLLIVFATEAVRREEERTSALMREVGIETKELDATETVAHEPALRDDLAGATWYPEDAHLRPNLLVAELLRAVVERGAEVCEFEEVRGLVTGGGRVTHVQTSRGVHTGDSVLLAAGSWTPKLAKLVRLRVPVQPGKGYSVTMHRPDPCPTTPLVLAEPSMAVTPWASGLRLGGTMEFSGYDETLRSSRLRALYRGGRRFLRGDLNREVEERWYGWRPMTPTDLPIIDRAPDLANLYLAVGHGMMGVSMAPASARLVRALITGEDPDVDPAPFALSMQHAVARAD